MNKKEPLKIAENPGNKKIFFGDDGEIIDKPLEKKEEKQNNKIKKSKNHMKNGNDRDIGSKWFEEYDEYNTKELSEIKESEFKTFEEHCKKCFDEEVEKSQKNNPSDAKWLQTALKKGTSKDAANAGALLVQSNPLSNMSSLETLISLTKFSNKNSADILETVTNLFKVILPSHRKLISLEQRGNDWKCLKKTTLDVATRNQIYALWFFENDLKSRYNTYLQNLQGSLQNGKEINKIKAIISASNLLKSCPEREAYLLNMIVNKFGDPDKKIASKATYNLRQILLTHPNMAHVMILETEKLIFRKNINELAQHYGIGFLSLIAPIANAQSSQKLIDICFCFFKIKIEKGDINSKTMQAILNCLRIAIQNINDFNDEKKKMEITTPDVVNTIYRLIYLSNISISFQALSLLLQLVQVQNENHDRFYNALYRKMIDSEILTASNKITSLYFHIIHRSVHQDSNVNRCKAFIKRLLQMTLSFSPSKACGALIVISKLLKSRPELKQFYLKTVTVKDESENDQKIKKYQEMDDDSEEEIYKDAEFDGTKVQHENGESRKAVSSWIHVKNDAKQKEETSSQIRAPPSKYDPFKRSAAFCGVEFTLFYELVLMSKYFHPTVQVFVENIMKSQKINYYGDPLKDFSLSHFLERFAFKNPKKIGEMEEKSAFKHHTYHAKGSRGQSVHSLTEQSCTEDERFIFDFIQRKREIREKNVKLSEEKEDESDCESVDDEEFDSYLNTLGAKADYDKSEEDFDYLSELQDKNSSKKESKGGKKKANDDENESEEDNWEDDDDDVSSGSEEDFNDLENFGNESGTDESIDDDMSDESDGTDDQSDAEPRSSKKAIKKSRKDEKGMNNLFVAVDDFSEMIEKNSSKHGTLGEIFNKDKSSQKQMDWEEKRHNRVSGFKRKNNFGKGKFPLKSKKSRK